MLFHTFLRNDLYCVGWGVELYSTVSSRGALKIDEMYRIGYRLIVRAVNGRHTVVKEAGTSTEALQQKVFPLSSPDVEEKFFALRFAKSWRADAFL